IDFQIGLTFVQEDMNSPSLDVSSRLSATAIVGTYELVVGHEGNELQIRRGSGRSNMAIFARIRLFGYQIVEELLALFTLVCIQARVRAEKRLLLIDALGERQ